MVEIRLMDVKEAAKQMLNVSPWTVRLWIRQGKLPFVRLGRRVLLDPKDLRAFIDENRTRRKQGNKDGESSGRGAS
ncbi:MAG: helix-turn-helix domain-containing protein [Acidobacteria bacterium]|nr:helix-turn-helix domain-containing protein [Acidobacteriota bacterium]